MSLSASGQSHVWHYAVSPRLSNISSKCAGCFWHCMILLLHPFNSLFSWTTWVSRCQKGKTSLDLNEARDNGILGCSGISWTVCKQNANNRSRQITTPTLHHSIFTGFALDIVGYSHGIFISHIDVVMCDRPSVLWCCWLGGNVLNGCVCVCSCNVWSFVAWWCSIGDWLLAILLSCSDCSHITINRCL